MWFRNRLQATRSGDRGAAVLTVLLMLGAMTAITTTVAVVTTNDTISASRDKQAAGALATADAGVAQALEWMRYNGVGRLTCLDNNQAACSANPVGFTNPAAPAQFRVDGGVGSCVAGSTCYKVAITALVPYDPPIVKTGRYRIYSTGVSGGGSAAKKIIVDVAATPARYPIGVYGDRLTGNGGTRISHEMLFTQDCVSPRHDGSGNGTRFEGIDPYWDEPASANSTTVVSTENGCGSDGYVHRNSTFCPPESALRYDRTSLGGTLPTGSACRTYLKLDGSTGSRTSSFFDLSILEDTYGFRPGGLAGQEYDALRVRAGALNLLNPTAAQLTTRLAAAVAAGVTNPVVYYDNAASVSLNAGDIPAVFGRAPTATCTPHSIVIVVRNGDLVYQGGNNEWRSLAIFVPEGNFRGNGGYNILGTLFAHNLSLGGNEEFRLDDCFVQNLPGPLVNLDVQTFREDDRTDVS